MPPGGKMFRFSETLGENVPRTRQAECLPYSKNAVRLEICKHQFVWQRSITGMPLNQKRRRV